MTLAQLVLSQNAPYKSPLRGAEVHQIDAATAQRVADLIQAAAQQTGLSVAYLAGCLCRESKFDPAAYNENLSLVNRTPAFTTTDFGIAQFSGRYLPNRPGMAGLTEAQMQAKACDPAWAIPTFAGIMAGNVTWAVHILAAYDQDQPFWGAIEKAVSNTLYATPKYVGGWLATYAYNSGNTGAIRDLLGVQLRISHPNAVMSTVLQFEGMLA